MSQPVQTPRTSLESWNAGQIYPRDHQLFTRLEIINQIADLIVHFILIRRWSVQDVNRERQVPGAVSARREEAGGAAANRHQTGPRAAQLLYWIHIIC